MKHLTLLFVLLLGITWIVSAGGNPPELPCSFYGLVYSAGDPVGQPVTVQVGDVVVVSSTVNRWSDGAIYYALNVPGEYDGEALVFTVGGVIAGEGVCRKATNTSWGLSIHMTGNSVDAAYFIKPIYLPMIVR